MKVDKHELKPSVFICIHVCSSVVVCVHMRSYVYIDDC